MANRWGNNDRLYLGRASSITAGGDCSHEIKRNLLLGRKVMTNLDSILKSRDITMPTKVHLVKAMVFPVVMYGCEGWTIKLHYKATLLFLPHSSTPLWCFLHLLWLSVWVSFLVNPNEDSLQHMPNSFLNPETVCSIPICSECASFPCSHSCSLPNFSGNVTSFWKPSLSSCQSSIPSRQCLLPLLCFSLRMVVIYLCNYLFYIFIPN